MVCNILIFIIKMVQCTKFPRITYLIQFCGVFSFPRKAAPYWIIAPQNLVLSPEEDGTLICRANGNPKPRISWLSNGVPIESKFP